MSQYAPSWEMALFHDFMFKPGPKCKQVLKRTGRECNRNKNHKGHHAYVGSKFYVTWERNKGGSK